MSNAIPKEQLSAYQRWELASFDEPPVVVPTAAEIAGQLESVRAEARTAAYAAGLEEGRAAGFEKGQAEGHAQGHAAGFEQGRAEGLAEGRAEAADERAQLQQLAQSFADEVTGASERIAVDVLELALDVAKAMLKTALSVRPELIIPVVSEAIRYLPAVQQPAMLFLHPLDAQLATTHIGIELDKAGWRVVEDAQIERGGCRVETASNQIDATTETRWQRISAALGKESDWLAQ